MFTFLVCSAVSRVAEGHAVLERVRSGMHGFLVATGIPGSECLRKPGDPHHIYLSFDEVKQAVLAEATSNARARAQTMAKAAGVSLGALRQVSFGDLEIRSPTASARYSDDESSPQKDVIANVKLLYLLK